MRLFNSEILNIKLFGKFLQQLHFSVQRFISLEYGTRQVSSAKLFVLFYRRKKNICNMFSKAKCKKKFFKIV